jgi:hypothetical protein
MSYPSFFLTLKDLGSGKPILLAKLSSPHIIAQVHFTGTMAQSTLDPSQQDLEGRKNGSW